MGGIVFLDSETNGLNPTEVHCIAVKADSMEQPILLDPTSFIKFAEEYKPKKWVIHNGLGFDCWVINKLIKPRLINPMDVIDTLVVSKLVNYEKFQTHSLEELGKYLGVYKGDFPGPWAAFTKEMGEYCIQDVVVLEAIFNMYRKEIFDPSWSKAMRLEHDTAIICNDLHYNGFHFDREEAEKTLNLISTDLKAMEDQIKEDFPPTLEEVKRLKYRTKKDGTLFSTTEEAMSSYPLTRVDGSDLVCYDYIPFNPGSTKQRIDKLWEAGWKPTEKTKGYKKWISETKKSWAR